MVTASNLVMPSEGAPPASWPLFVTASGRPLSSHAFISFYKDVYRAIGFDPAKAQGHSARIWGSRQLARMNIEIPVIQVFCRWGGPTVLRYLSDEALGIKGVRLRTSSNAAPSLAEITAKVNVAVSKQLAVLKSPAWEPDLPALAAAAADKVSEHLLALHNARGPERIPSILPQIESLVARLASLETDVVAISGSSTPRFVACDCRWGGKLHRALATGVTLCGWPWKARGGRPIAEAQWLEATTKMKCDRCS